MKRNSTRFVTILATISVLGILLIQFFFLKNSFDLYEKQFHELATSALKNVANHLIEYNNKTKGYASKNPEANNVDRISNNYYIVNINDVIDPNLLEFYLIDEFKKHNLKLDFEYGIYDCESEKMLHGKMITPDSLNITSSPSGTITHSGCSAEDDLYEKHYTHVSDQPTRKCNLPKCDKYTYYFGVHFPDRSQFYNSRLKIWYVMTSFLILVISFFGYTVYIIFKQRQLSEIQKNFINNLTHEFKTPIASIGLSAKVLENPSISEQPERLHEYAKIISQQNKRLSAQVEKLLQMASIERTKLQLNIQKIELCTFIPDTIQEFKNSQNGNKYQINFSNQAGEKASIKADPLHFSNLIFNILDNAIKYCHEEPTIQLTLNETSKVFILSFADNGIGIPKNYRKKIFNRFFRVPTGNIHDVKGFGLGLDYVKKITDLHHWHIQVTDNSPKGTIFILKIRKN
jgi:two-component system phosphate regulon sensor histidine kinase PhoR